MELLLITLFLIFLPLFYTSEPKVAWKCLPKDDCWPAEEEWSFLNDTLNGALIRAIPPASACYPTQPNYDEKTCAFIRAQWFNSSWHAEHPVSIDYPIWTNNSCNPIWPNGTSITGDIHAGENGCSIGAYPAYIVNATTASQISHTVRWVNKKNIRLIVKSTGHSYTGRSVGCGSVSVWTHHLRGIQYIPDFRATSCHTDEPQSAVRVAAGHSNGDVQTDMAKHSSIIVTGATASVGLIGWLTGGGHGYLSQTYGMGSDNLLEASIVTPDGILHTASPCQNPDLFFAIRGGGGGTFGVVTEVVVKTYPTPKTTVHKFQLSVQNFATVDDWWNIIAYIHSDLSRLKEGGMQGYYYITGPPAVEKFTLMWTFMLVDKPTGVAEQLMAPIESYLSERAHLFNWESNIMHEDTYLEAYLNSVSSEPVATFGSAYGSRLLGASHLTNGKATAAMFASLFSPSPDTSNVTIHPALLIGHLVAPSSLPTYHPTLTSLHPAWRDTLVHLILAQSWQDGSEQAVIDAVYRDVSVKTGVLRRLAPEMGAYFNEPDAYEPESQRAFWGTGYEKLAKLKRLYDPRGVFWCRGCVGSERWEENEGRLYRNDGSHK